MAVLCESLKQKMRIYPPFYRQVWIECAKIPAGEVRTYKEIAVSIGNPRASRAVANALASNPFAPVIPCHRVIRSDGKIGGYSGKGGIKTKLSLLKKEGIRILRGKVLKSR